jgi:hypothetical protein
LAQARQLGFAVEEVINVLRRRDAEMRGGTKEGKQHG